MVSFSQQVKVLLWKDLRLARVAWKATVVECVVPVFVGLMTGLMMTLLLHTIETGSSEWSNVHTVPAIQNMTNPPGRNYNDFANANAVSTSTTAGGGEKNVKGFVLDGQQEPNVGIRPSRKLYKMGWVGIGGQSEILDKVFDVATSRGSLLDIDRYNTEADLVAGYEELLNNTVLRDWVMNYTGISLGPYATTNFSFWSRAGMPTDGRMEYMGLTKAFNDARRLLANANASLPPNPNVKKIDIEWSYQSIFMTVNLRAIFAAQTVMLLIYAFIPSTLISAGRLVEAKRVKMRETLKVMGVTDAAYTLSSFIACFLRIVIGAILMGFILAAFGAIEPGNIATVLIGSVLFSMTLVAFAQFVPAVVSSPMWCNVMSIFFIAIGAVLSSISTGWPHALQLITCLMSPVAYSYAVLPSFTRGSVTLSTTPAQAMVMLAIDFVLMMTAACYLYAVAPGEFGVPKHPLFFIRWIWHKPAPVSTTGADDERLLNNAAGGSDNAAHGLGDDEERRVLLRGLTKQFGEFTAVNKLSLDIKKGEIYALLGHNGAGKTTTMSMLTGMITPTSYDTAIINGHDLSQEMDRIRDSVGLCPQFDVLFDSLSARDHLTLFAGVKGKSDDEEVTRMLDALELPLDSQRVSTYSGGMKRRLSVGNALIGGASLVFLDEPSSGMDPLSRRKMWDLLGRVRAEGRTIVLTTHFMEEADYLGDRIAIMTKGTMFKCATSSELKQQYGTGQTLTVAKKTNAPSLPADHGDLVLRVLQRQCEGVRKISEGVADMAFEVPNHELPKIGKMLKELEGRMGELVVSSYGVSMCTLEDVFVAISSSEEAKEAEAKQALAAADEASGIAAASGAAAVYGTTGDDPSVNSPTAAAAAASTVDGQDVALLFEQAKDASVADPRAFWWSHFKSVFHRKWIFLRRSRRLQLMVFLFPLFFLLIGFMAIQANPNKNKHHGFQVGKQVDMSALNAVFLDLRDHDMNGAIRAEFAAQFAEQYPASSLSWLTVNKYEDFAAGVYLPLHTLSFISGYKSPPVPFGFSAHSTANLDDGMTDGAMSTASTLSFSAGPTGGGANFTRRPAKISLMWNEQFDMSLAPSIMTIMQTTLQKIYGWPLENCTIEAEYLAATGQQKTITIGGDDGAWTIYNITQIGIYIILSIGQVLSQCAQSMGDEVNRNVYHTLLAQGMRPSAYFAANFLFDFMCGTFPILLLILGFAMKHMHQFLTSTLPIYLFSSLLYVAHVTLHSHIVVTYLASLPPFAHTIIIHVFGLATMAAPYLVDLIMSSASVPGLDSIEPFLFSIFPSTAFYHVLDKTADLTKETAGAHALLTFQNPAPVRSIIALLLELAVPVLVIYSFATNGFLFQHWTAFVARRAAAKAAKEADKKAAEQAVDPLATGGSVSKKPPLAKTSGTGPSSFCQNDSAQAMRETEDDDVHAEAQRVARIVARVAASNGGATVNIDGAVPARPGTSGENGNDDAMLILDRLRKVYPTGKVAVKSVNVGIGQGECFGLLGPNGAGKSTTCNLILRQLMPTEGEVLFPYGNVSASTPSAEAFRNAQLGVCQQHNTLWELLTAEEHMQEYLKTRLGQNYSAEKWADYIKASIDRVRLGDALQKQSGGYSGGMKRKLQVSLSMFTGAKTVFLDEPSTGMDPFARRALWSVIKQACSQDKCVVLTTHSMEEAEEVCSRIGIVTAGRMRCLGSSQHLKDKFGGGYVVTLMRAADSTEAQEAAIARELPELFGQGITLTEELGLMQRYTTDSVESLAEAFVQVEERRAAWGVEQYSISQTASLEQIFLSFVATTRED